MESGERKNACQHIVYKTGIQGDLLELIHIEASCEIFLSSDRCFCLVIKFWFIVA